MELIALCSEWLTKTMSGSLNNQTPAVGPGVGTLFIREFARSKKFGATFFNYNYHCLEINKLLPKVLLK